MRRIAIINQKGGVGKTTTAVNVGMALSRLGQRVLLIDLDAQAHLSMHLGIDPAEGVAGTYEMLTESVPLSEVVRQVADNLWVVASNIDLAAAEVELVSVVGREVILCDALDQHMGGSDGDGSDKYDYVLMDCPPSLGVLTLNGLCAAHEVFIPLQPHYLALQGLGKLMETILLVTKRINPSLKVGGVMVCMHDAGTRLAAEVIEEVRVFLDQSRGSDVPWSSARLFETLVRRNIKLAEAPSHGKSIFDYAPDSNVAKDYHRLSLEIHDPSLLAEMSQGVDECEPAEQDHGHAAHATREQAGANDECDSVGPCRKIDPAITEPMKPDTLKIEVDKQRRAVGESGRPAGKRDNKGRFVKQAAQPPSEPVAVESTCPVPESEPEPQSDTQTPIGSSG